MASVHAIQTATGVHRWIVRLDPATGAATVLFTDHDDAWIRELFQNASGFLSDSKTFYFTSEKTGYMHLYAVDASAASPEVLT